jgi:hypothetical protein
MVLEHVTCLSSEEASAEYKIICNKYKQNSILTSIQNSILYIFTYCEKAKVAKDGSGIWLISKTIIGLQKYKAFKN